MVRQYSPQNKDKDLWSDNTSLRIRLRTCGQTIPQNKVTDLWSDNARLGIRLKPVLNWVNVSSRTYLEVFSEASWFLIGPTFLCEPSWKYLSKLYSGSKKLCSTCSGNIRPIGQSLPLIG